MLDSETEEQFRPNQVKQRNGREENNMGMSTRIGRSIKTCEANCIVVENNDVVHKKVTLAGDYADVKRARNAVRKKLGNDQVLVESVDVRVDYYSMPITEFIKYADKKKSKEKEN